MVNDLVDLTKERLGSSTWFLEERYVDDPNTSTWVLDFDYDKNPIPVNGGHGHHMAHARKVKRVRNLARREAALCAIPPLGHCRVELTWYVVTAGRRDVDNLALTAKAMYDGLVDAGIVTDDTPDLMDKLQQRIIRVDGRHVTAWMELVVTRWEGPDA